MFNRHFLNIGLIFSSIAPFITHKIYLDNKTKSEIRSFEHLGEALNITSNVTTNNLNILDYIHYLYFAISILIILRLFINIIAFYKHIKPLKKYKKDGVIFIESEDTDSPYSFMKNIVYNPKLFSTKELKDILNHEKEHSYQKHSYDIILTEIYKAINWLNPVAWLYKKAIVQNLEFLADTKAIKKAKSKKEYQNTMLKISISATKIRLANNFYDHLIKKRISLINTNKSKKVNLMKSLLVLPVIILFLSTNTELVAQEQKQDINTENSPAYVVINKIESSVSETIDQLIANTPGYGKNSSPLYVIDNMLFNRTAIEIISNNEVEAIGILKKEHIEERYGKGAVESGVIHITTKNKYTTTVVGKKIKQD